MNAGGQPVVLTMGCVGQVLGCVGTIITVLVLDHFHCLLTALKDFKHFYAQAGIYFGIPGHIVNTCLFLVYSQL
jgi:hypothetical protein